MSYTITPLPWVLDGAQIIDRRTNGETPLQICRISIQPDNGTADANAEFIVRAVNSHAELLGMLQAILERFDVESPTAVFPASAMREEMRRTIAKAKASPLKHEVSK